MKPTDAMWTGVTPSLALKCLFLNGVFLTEMACSPAPPTDDNQHNIAETEDPEETPSEETPPIDDGMGGKANDPYDPCPPCDVTPSVTIQSEDEILDLPYLPDTYFSELHHERCIQQLILRRHYCLSHRNASIRAAERPASHDDEGPSTEGGRLELTFGGGIDEPLVTGGGTFRDAEGTTWTLELVDELPASFLEESRENSVQATLDYIGTNVYQESKSFRVVLAVCAESAHCLL